MRLNRYLAEAGLFSRREADRMIEEGFVAINGATASLGTQVEEGDLVTFKGQVVRPVEEKFYVMVHKPAGIEVTMNRSAENNIADFMNLDQRLFPVGRLDKDSEGLLLLTNDGDTANAILKAANGHEKEYLVTVDKTISDAFIKAMGSGVEILDRVTAPCEVVKIEKNVFKIILKQGLNRQIRRMCEALGYKVTRLIRVRVMHLELSGLEVGKWRDLTVVEREQLIEDCNN